MPCTSCTTSPSRNGRNGGTIRVWLLWAGARRLHTWVRVHDTCHFIFLSMINYSQISTEPKTDTLPLQSHSDPVRFRPAPSGTHVPGSLTIHQLLASLPDQQETCCWPLEFRSMSNSAGYGLLCECSQQGRPTAWRSVICEPWPTATGWFLISVARPSCRTHRVVTAMSDAAERTVGPDHRMSAVTCMEAAVAGSCGRLYT